MENTEVKTQEQTDQTEERTFTQAELNAIVQKRVGELTSKYKESYEEFKEKAQKFDEIEEASKSELQKATERAEALQKQINSMKKADEIRDLRAKVAKAQNLPADLLTGETEEECVAQAKAILDFKKSSSYPVVKDAGEVHKVTTGKTRDQFANWFNENF